MQWHKNDLGRECIENNCSSLIFDAAFNEEEKPSNNVCILRKENIVVRQIIFVFFNFAINSLYLVRWTPETNHGMHAGKGGHTFFFSVATSAPGTPPPPLELSGSSFCSLGKCLKW